jgi:hypothetical protein
MSSQELQWRADKFVEKLNEESLGSLAATADVLHLPQLSASSLRMLHRYRRCSGGTLMDGVATGADANDVGAPVLAKGSLLASLPALSAEDLFPEDAFEDSDEDAELYNFSKRLDVNWRSCLTSVVLQPEQAPHVAQRLAASVQTDGVENDGGLCTNAAVLTAGVSASAELASASSSQVTDVTASADSSDSGPHAAVAAVDGCARNPKPGAPTVPATGDNIGAAAAEATRPLAQPRLPRRGPPKPATTSAAVSKGSEQQRSPARPEECRATAQHAQVAAAGVGSLPTEWPVDPGSLFAPLATALASCPPGPPVVPPMATSTQPLPPGHSAAASAATQPALRPQCNTDPVGTTDAPCASTTTYRYDLPDSLS